MLPILDGEVKGEDVHVVGFNNPELPTHANG
jgi:hypothetical protein